MNNEHRLRLCGGGFNEQDAQLVLHTNSRLFDWPLDGLFDLGKSMKRNNIIRIAQEAGLHIATDVKWMPIIGLEYAEKFAKLVAQHEREACEALHDHEDVQAPVGNSSWGEAYQEGWGQGTAAYRDAIKARGQA
jgi:hypothetical protein